MFKGGDRGDHSLMPQSKITIIISLARSAPARTIYNQIVERKRKRAIKSLHLVENLFFLTLIQTSVNLNTAFSKPEDHGMPGYMCLCEITGFATEVRQSCHHGFPLWVCHTFDYLFSHIYISKCQKHPHPPIHNHQRPTHTHTTSPPSVTMMEYLFQLMDDCDSY